MLSQAINPSTNQHTNNQQENFIKISLSIPITNSSTTTTSSSSQSKDHHQNHQLYQYHHQFQQSRWQNNQQRIWKPPQNPHQYKPLYHHWNHHHHQYPKPIKSISIFSLIKNQYHPGKGVTLHYHHHLVTKLLSPTLRKSMNFLLTVLLLNLLHRVPCTLAANPPGTNDNNNNLITNPYDLNIINNIDNVYDKEVTLTSSSLGNLEDDFSLSSLTHSRPVLLSSPSPKLPVASSTLLSQSYSPSTSSSQKQLGSSSSSSPTTSSQLSPSSLSSLSSPSSSSSSLTQPSTTEATSSPVSPGSYYSFISSHHPTQLSHYYLQINKPQQSSPPLSTTTTTTTQQQSTYNNNNNANEINIKTRKDFENLFHRIARRSSRPYDVPQIECPLSEDGVDRFACPTPNKEGRYRCIEDHELCNGFIACPNAEDEDRKLCMFYKTTKAHLDVLADAMLRMVQGRF